jgi:hypothetical protein
MPETLSSAMPVPQWRPEVTTIGEEVWSTNSVRLATRREALDWVENLARRWTLVTRWRAADDSTPTGQAYVPGSEDGAW